MMRVPANNMYGRYPSAPAAAGFGTPPAVGKLTFTGFFLAVFSLAIAMSAWGALRVPIPLLNAHPYLIAMLPVFVYVLFARLTQFPTGVLLSMLMFCVMYSLSVMSGEQIYLQELVKIWAGAATVLTAALAVRSVRDYRAGVLALTTALLVMSIKGIMGADQAHVGVDPLDTGNENSWSLYNLPPLLLAGHMALDKSVKTWIRAFCGMSFAVIAVAVLASANRSGWLGLAMVGPMLFLGKGQKLQSMIFVVIIGVATFLLMEQFGLFETIQEHWAATKEGKTSDQKRVTLIMTALQIGLENPILGASPQNLYRELARRVFGIDGIVDSHNVFAAIIGGSGYPAMFILFLAAFLLWRRPAGVPSDFFGNQRAASAHYILRMMILLWGVRGFFSREILYSPVFCVGVGICIGWCMIEGVWKPAAEQKRNAVGLTPAEQPPAAYPYRGRPGLRPLPRRAW